MDWVADVSFAHDEMTGSVLNQLGAAGVIGYVSDDPRKNLTHVNLIDYQNHNVPTALVFEDLSVDMVGGLAAGHAHGLIAIEQAHALGYDAANSVIFAANDRNTAQGDWGAVLEYMTAFAALVPVPGYYGDQDSIDFLYPRFPDWIYWQSNSTSFGNGVSAHADLIQRYDDPRVAGRPLDASDILTARIPFMGVDMFTQADRDMLTDIASRVQKVSYTEGLTLPAIAEIRGNAQNIAKALTGLHTAPDPTALAAALAPLIHTVDPAALVDAMSQALAKISVTVTTGP